jgi:non-canonical (house-cleaning) NTP pyrophosphatase
MKIDYFNFYLKIKMNVLLCSTSPLKFQAVTEYFREILKYENLNIEAFNCENLKLPSQPVNNTALCAQERLNYVKNKTKQYDYIISIENGLRFHVGSNDLSIDECYVILEYKDLRASGKSEVRVPKKYSHLLKNFNTSSHDKFGESCITLGEMISQLDSSIDPKNWMKTECGYDRIDMIKDALKFAFFDLKNQLNKVEYLIKTYKTYPDFPKPGVLFQDIFSVLTNPDATKALCNLFKHRYGFNMKEINYVVGLESRGFFGILLARELGI